MDAAVTIKATPAEYDLLRTALSERHEQLMESVKGAPPSRELNINRTYAAKLGDLLAKLQ